MSRRSLFVSFVALLMAVPATAGMRTKMIRLVPETGWVAEPGPIAVSVRATATGEEVSDLRAGLEQWATAAFEKLDFQVEDDADLVFRVTIDEFDFGSQAKRLIYGGGKAYLAGTVVVTRGNEEVARYRYSAKPRGGFTAGSMNRMAKEVAPPLVLKWTEGETDTELHER